ncbi:Hypoxanthine-guanine-xanthine phosphoribosyltransferase [Tritrichomonas foetus]|uniref:Hypoxanthine-guanine-xanthine phosphoribosyltransferase n=2 Tax=Tritrichomonas TaxID=5723 RepID=HGXR_TRIFO|nr:RecName: Full=Hypoxanthine-guanine-xanthine phosphoribosyltransferase; Short=HGPRT; Short=HGXPRT; Short=HGXPRTase [Tritrichomonas suis]AAC37202.1 hypoxanthine-guanine-xanthine phosphoribosyltransferase [Tritrichomonas foetus]OHT14114.1 Hypoxanthine-guanine-xanthine phosphoribosyltransferase [Tritrichomonas foetus]1HGX_A Chain A, HYPOXANTHINE-GUANINE-XANTHINE PHOSPHORIBOSYLTRANSFERASE [Tritrichomonas foetus]1HGX_B Chain B, HYPOXANTHINE-GUANINE-XANTHINE PHOSPHORIBOSYLTRANSFERASE [Tritrichomona|eukprot:OHT14114.1 Hypoxanthine-guanine-xanthine phosphoribosyltransferase [Tritrichomonas foetus]
MTETPMMDDLERVLYNQDDIQKRIRELAAELTEFYEDKNPVMICVLTGAVFFYTDLLKHLDFQLEPDYIICSSYSGTKSTGNLTISKDLKTNIEGRHVLVVEDIIDTGLTMYQLLNNLQMRKPASLKVCTLCDKDIGKKAYDVPIDYCGFVVENRYIIGYGFDFHNKYRNLPVIGILKESVYT